MLLTQCETAQADAGEKWNRFFSSLAFAERAAAEQCELIAAAYDSRQDRAGAETYREYAGEERRHFELARRACRSLISPPPRAEQAYAGALMSAEPSLAERLAVVHLAFEPSALAFLGHLYRNAESLLRDAAWARSVRESFGTILREEVTHTYQGRATLIREWEKETLHGRKTILGSLRRHRAFLCLGLQSFFGGSRDAPPGFVRSMLRDYDARYSKFSRGISP